MTTFNIKLALADIAENNTSDLSRHTAAKLRSFVESAFYEGYKSTYDNGWEWGFVVQPDATNEEKWVVFHMYGGCAGDGSVHVVKCDDALAAMKLCCERMFAEIGDQYGSSIGFEDTE